MERKINKLITLNYSILAILIIVLGYIMKESILELCGIGFFVLNLLYHVYQDRKARLILKETNSKTNQEENCDG